MVRVTTTSTQGKLCTLVLQGAQMGNNCFQQKHGQNKTSQSRRRARAEPTFLQTIKRRRYVLSSETCLHEYRAIPHTASSFSAEVSHTFKFSTAATLLHFLYSAKSFFFLLLLKGALFSEQEPSSIFYYFYKKKVMSVE